MKGIKDVYRELRPVFFLSKFIGLAPYNYHLQLSKMSCLITFFLILLTSAATGLLVAAPVNDTNTFSLILDRGQILLLGFTTIIALAKSPMNAASLTDLGRLLVKIDTDLKSVGVFVSHSYRFGLLGVIVRCITLFPLLISGFFTTNATMPLLHFIALEYVDVTAQLVTFVIEMQLMTLANCVRTRVAIMTKHLNAIAAQLYSYKPKKLLVLSSCHSSLVDTVSTINDLFTVQMLFIMFTIFLLATGRLYELIAAITKTINKEDVLPLLFVTFKVCLRSFEIWTITTVCVEVQENIKEFNSVLYQVLIEDESGVLAENKKLQLHVSMKKEVEFTAYNFFPIDYTLVHSMISAATTYLVILIQFSSISTEGTGTSAPPESSMFEKLWETTPSSPTI